MSQPTQRYKRSFSGSVGSGMKSVFGGEGRRYYILEHKVSSKYHKAGESQKIIVDQIELGRDSKCQVRFDESFDIVSRRHAAIVKDGDNWKLVQLSATNPTYLNGHEVKKEWFLQSGDEIQLATNGPKLGFIVPQGDKGLVKSIGMTARLNLFRQQALRPYKQAMATMACVLLLVVCGGGYTIFSQSQEIKAQAALIAEGEKRIEEIIAKYKATISELNEQIADSKKIAQTALKRAETAEEKIRNIPVASDVNMTPYHPYVFFIKCYKITVNGSSFFEVDENDWFKCGTGFLLSDGKFVTARHVSDLLYYSNDYYFDSKGELKIRPEANIENVGTWLKLNDLANKGADVTFYYKAVSSTLSFSFTNKDFVCDKSKDRLYTIENGLELTYKIIENGKHIDKKIEVSAGSMIRMGPSGIYDWAYIQTSQTEGLRAARNESTSLSQGTTLIILGYPHGRGEGNPILSEAKCAQNGLDNDGTIMASNDNTEGGNSGGPVFIMTGDGAAVVGIVSGATYEKGRFVPIKVIP